MKTVYSQNIYCVKMSTPKMYIVPKYILCQNVYSQNVYCAKMPAVKNCKQTPFTTQQVSRKWRQLKNTPGDKIHVNTM